MPLSYFRTSSPALQWSLHDTGLHEVHFRLTLEGEGLFHDYRRYRGKNLWFEVKRFVTESRLLESPDLDTGEDDAVDWYLYAQLPLDEWVDMAQKVADALDAEAVRVWTAKSALPLGKLVRGRLNDGAFLVRAALAYADLHGTAATRRTLAGLGLM